MVSAVVLTKNEEKNIEECLRTLRWCDEIIIIDDYSEDKTLEKIFNEKDKMKPLRPWKGGVSLGVSASSFPASSSPMEGRGFRRSGIKVCFLMKKFFVFCYLYAVN